MEVDERFSKLSKDPRYKRIAKKERKVKIDSRFEKMFTDERFHTKYTTDKRGKTIYKTKKEDLHKFYDIDEHDDSEVEDIISADDDETKTSVIKNVNKKNKPSVGNKNELKKKRRKLLATVTKGNTRLSAGRKVYLNKIKKGRKLKTSEEDKKVTQINFDDIRGETLPEEDTSDSDQSIQNDNDCSDADAADSNDIIHGWGELDENVNRIGNAETCRLAVCNCDWDKIGADDLFVLFNSFKTVNGIIKSVQIYPSEFGIERMKEEKLSGPKELRESAVNNDNDDKGNEEGSHYHMEKLREYQLNRLKYYYAVLECDNVETANKIYEECDGQEYEMSATRMDLRFIPEDTTFDHKPKSVATGMPQLKNYEPISFHNTALQQSTVRLTWDETDPKRVQATMKQFTKDDIEKVDFKDYLASASDDDDIEDEADDEGEMEEETVTSDFEVRKLDNKTNGNDSDDSTENTVVISEDKRIQIYREIMQEIEAKEDKDNNKEDMEVSFKMGINTESDQITDSNDYNKISINNTSRQQNNKNQHNVHSDSENELTSEDNDTDDNQVLDNKDDDLISNHDDDDVNKPSTFNDPFFDDASVPNKKKIKAKKKKKTQKHLNDTEDAMTEIEKKSKNELELLMLDESEDKKHFSLQDILNQENTKQSKRKRKKCKEIQEDTFKIDVDDPRFSALYSSHLYAIDPSEPNFKKTKATDAIIQESQRRMTQHDDQNINSSNNVKGTEGMLDSNLSGLIKSVKSKTMLHKWKKGRKKPT